MEDYAIVTLNTSEIGHNVFNTTASTDSGLSGFLQNLTNIIESDLDSDLNSEAKKLGVHDWYSAHILDYCEGFYTPTPVPNATVSKSEIHKNITHCSNRTSFFHFDPTTILQAELNKSDIKGLNLSSLDWPSGVTHAVNTVRIAQKAAFVLYCLAVALLFATAVCSLLGIFFTGRLAAFGCLVMSSLAFWSILIASALTTTVAVKVADVVNDKGKVAGVAASKGDKFLALTWVAVGLAFVDALVWTVECVFGRRMRANKGGYTVEPKR